MSGPLPKLTKVEFSAMSIGRLAGWEIVPDTRKTAESVPWLDVTSNVYRHAGRFFTVTVTQELDVEISDDDAETIDCAQSRPPVACPKWGPTARKAIEGSFAMAEVYPQEVMVTQYVTDPAQCVSATEPDMTPAELREAILALEERVEGLECLVDQLATSP